MFLFRCVLLSIILITIAAGTRTHADGPVVVINEVLWMGSAASSADEWIELRNLSDQPVDISNWQLTKKSSGTETPMLTIPAGTLISAQGYFLMSNYAETHASSNLGLSPGYITTDVALSNTALQLKLYDSAHVLLDTADDGVGNPLAGAYDASAHVYASMERNSLPDNGTLATSWHTATMSVGWKPESMEKGTPGSTNSHGQPTAAAGPDQTAIAGQTVNFDGSDSSDPENVPLTFAWNFGDNQTAAESTPRHVYASAGTYTVTLAISNGFLSATDTTQIRVDAAPVPVPTTPTTMPAASGINPTVPATTATSCRGLRLNEIFPDPPGDDGAEFIELVNDTAAPISVTGCALWVNTARAFTLTGTDTVAAHGYFVVLKNVSHLSLVNTGATIRLVDRDGTELQRTAYPAAIKKLSWSWLSGSWAWTSPTPAQVNAEPAEAVPSQSSASRSGSKTTVDAKKKTIKAAPVVTDMSIEEANRTDVGELVRVTGTVTASNDILGSHLLFIEDDQGAIPIRLYEGGPRFTIGQHIQVEGKLQSFQGGRLIKVSASLGRAIVTPGQSSITPDDMTIDGLNQELANHLVHIRGTIGSVSATKITIDDGTGEANVYIKPSTGITRPTMHSGDTLEVTGIVSVMTTGTKILPRTTDDLRVERVLGTSVTNTNSAMSAPKAVATSSPAQTRWYWVAVMAGGLVAAAKPVWTAWRKGLVHTHGTEL